MPDFYFAPEDTISVDYQVTVSPPPADHAEVSFFKREVGGELISGQSLSQPEGTVTLGLNGLNAMSDSPIWAQFVFEKAEGKPKPRVEQRLAFSLAEPVVEAIQAPADAKPGDVIELGIVRWGADAYDVPGRPTRYSNVDPASIPRSLREQARWTKGGQQVAEGESYQYTVEDADLGTMIEFEAYTAAPSGAVARVAVPKIEIVRTADGSAPPEAVALGQALDLTARVTPEIRGRLTWELGDPALSLVSAGGREAKIEATADASAEVTIRAKLVSDATGNEYVAEVAVKVVTLRMHLDADRDGTVDDDTSGLDRWEWGASKKGAIVRVNLDDEDGKRATDASNDKVDTDADAPDLAPLELRRGATAFPSGWTAVLSASHADKLRIFDARAASGAQVIGPSAPGPYTLTDLGPATHAWGMEAVSYPTAGFDGLITLTLELKDPTGAVAAKQTAKVRVAPWLMTHHLMPTEQVYVAATSDNATFRSELAAHVTAAGVPAPVEADEATFGNDRWMQDVMEVGFSTLPGAGAPADRHLPVILRTANDRARLWGGRMDSFPLERLLGPGYGLFLALPPTLGSSLDSFGNLECSPPVTVGGKEWKFGRVIYGHDASRPMQPKVIDFLQAQVVQGAFSVDTSWLVVGHVDEIFSFLPAPSAPKKFKLLIVSPAEGMAILKQVQADGHGSVTFTKNLPMTVDGALASATFGGIQTTVQGRIDAVEAKLRANLGLDAADVIKIPVLFKREGARYIALTANSVNMLVVTKADGHANLCVPKPFGPVVGGVCRFERDIEAKLAPFGNSLRFIDDWETYHENEGEIHCGTNQRRTPPTDRWWWEQVP